MFFEIPPLNLPYQAKQKTKVLGPLRRPFSGTETTVFHGRGSRRSSTFLAGL